jgi:sarcosine oxidase, subunit delta
MLLIECPYCGPRNEIEFRNGGQAHVPYPADPSALSDREWAEYLFFRDNPRGRFAERWVHTAGCRKWFNAIRDTATYEFAAVYPIDTASPESPSTSCSDASIQPAEAPAPSPTDSPAAEGENP